MKRQDIIPEILCELERAKKLHPDWPEDQVHAAAIVNEEAGELIRAVLNETYHGTDARLSDVEAIQTAAMCIRFLEGRK